MSNVNTANLPTALVVPLYSEVMLRSNGSVACTQLTNLKSKLLQGPKNTSAYLTSTPGTGEYNGAPTTSGINFVAFAHFTPASGTNSAATILASRNVASVNMGATGTYTITYSTPHDAVFGGPGGLPYYTFPMVGALPVQGDNYLLETDASVYHERAHAVSLGGGEPAGGLTGGGSLHESFFKCYIYGTRHEIVTTNDVTDLASYQITPNQFKEAFVYVVGEGYEIIPD